MDDITHLSAAHTDYSTPEARANQRSALLAYLRRNGSISTFEARDLMAVAHPAGRSNELRRQGHGITTRRDPLQECARHHLAVNQGAGDAID